MNGSNDKSHPSNLDAVNRISSRSDKMAELERMTGRVELPADDVDIREKRPVQLPRLDSGGTFRQLRGDSRQINERGLRFLAGV